MTRHSIFDEVLMAGFVLQRIGQTVIVLLIASVIVFALMRLMPGDPVQIIMGSEYSPEAEAQLRQQLGLDRSILAQYVIWIGNVLRAISATPTLTMSTSACCYGMPSCPPSFSSSAPPSSAS
jgi:ABC-type dipeptide/oligopeptide/nickel transport system permease component